VARVGVLFGSPAPSWIEALRQGLRDVGLVEGRTVLLEWRSADGRYERLPGLATELVRLGVDVLVAHPTVAVQAARRATTTIPIVMPASADPVGAGLVESLARPGGNITGSTFISSEITGKRLELLKEMVPHANSVAVVANPDNPATALQLAQVRAAGTALGVRLRFIEVQAETQLDAAFAALLRDRADALFVIDDPMLGSKRVDIVKQVATARLPAMYGWRSRLPRFLHGSHGKPARTLRSRRARSSSPTRSPFQRHRASHRPLGRSADRRCLPRRFRTGLPPPRPRCRLR
jgi:ABC-type uncharacterized transport system substrate-binding protein